jgi:hypothetical protein
LTFSDADTSRLNVLGNLGNPVGFIDFTTKFNLLGSIVYYSQTSDADVDMHIRSKFAAFGAIKNILTNKDIDLKVKGRVYVELRLNILMCIPTSIFGAYGKICSISFVTSITDALEPCAAIPSFTQLAIVFHLPASLSALPLSPTTEITIVGFFDGQATSPGCHLTEPQ